MVGNSLVLDCIEKDKNIILEHEEPGNYANKRVVLIGHSMECAATLKMGLTLSGLQNNVILVALALIGEPLKQNNGLNSASLQNTQNSFIRFLWNFKNKILQLFAYFNDVRIELLSKFVLSRGVGTLGFWSIGHYDPTEEDALASQSPDGILAFAKS